MDKEATIFDLAQLDFSEIPLDNEYIVDTNILYRIYYSKYPINDYSGKMYSKLIEYLSEKDVLLRTTTYNIAELMHLIEKKEYDLYLESINATKDTFSLKSYRQLTQEREKIQDELELVLLQISTMFEIDEVTTKYCILEEFANNYPFLYCDNYDYSIIKNYTAQNKFNFISHDVDFAYISGINLYTVNKTAITSETE